jgi:hypothetical protein
VDIKRTRLKWFRNVIRMDQTEMAKTIFDSRSQGRRKVGRPTLKQLEEVENDL